MIGPIRIPTETSRRAILKGGAAMGAGLVVGFHWPAGGRKAFAAAEAAGEGFAPNAFVRVAPDGWVTVVAKHLEMGQGVHTGLATIVAEELDADWAMVRVESAPADASRYNNLHWGPAQGTGGSSSIANSFQQLRQAGAAARAMLVAAAAGDWGAPAGEIVVRHGVLSHAASGRSAGFGEMAAKAAALPVPAEVTLKDPKDFTLIGHPRARVDRAAKTDGSAVFASDVTLPGMLTAVVQRPPRFGATVKGVDAAAAKAVKGVVEVVTIPRGVAGVAEGFWAAQKGREALVVAWDESAAETRGSAELRAECAALARTPGAPARRDGDADAALAKAATVIQAEYDFPYLAHAPMEPLSCVARIGEDGVDVWAGHQIQTLDQFAAARIAGVDPAKVRLHTVFAGGSFGRRAVPDSDYVAEAVGIAKAVGRPVKLIWTREDDLRGGRYRPLYHHALAAGLDADGRLVAWRHRIVGQSILAGSPFEAALVKDGIDKTSVEGASTLPYAIPNLSVEMHTVAVKVPVLWWRAVGSTHTAYSTETFLDEIAAKVGKDPVEFRRGLLSDHPRHLGVLNLAAEKAGWGAGLPAGWARGVAVHESFNSFVAQVAEVSQGADGRIRVERVVCAVDCGVAINPDVVAAQMEGGIGFGLGAILAEEITIERGRPAQSNFHDYTPLRIDRMPRVEVHIVASAEPPTGVGEPGLPPVGPAVANAIAALTGKRIRALPMKGQVSV